MQSKVLVQVVSNHVPYYQFPSFQHTGLVKHGFSTKLGGVSSGIFESMNLGYKRGDADEQVDQNYQLFCSALGIEPKNLVFSYQVHEDVLQIVTKEDCMNDINQFQRTGVDGLITNCKNVALVTSYADCVPLFFLDPVKQVIALSHAGWRGTVMGIGPKTIRTMNQSFGCKPEDILVGIGPSIGPCCFEVSADVKIEVEKKLNHDIIDKIVKNVGNMKYLVDLWTFNEELLMEVGVLRSHIAKTDLCTMCHQDIFFSHRGTNGQRGSQVAMMELIEGGVI